jgi:hypothetical protein
LIPVKVVEGDDFGVYVFVFVFVFVFVCVCVCGARGDDFFASANLNICWIGDRYSSSSGCWMGRVGEERGMDVGEERGVDVGEERGVDVGVERMGADGGEVGCEMVDEIEVE